MPGRPTDRWLDRVCAHVSGTRRRAAIRRELDAHLEDRIRTLISQGMTPAQAAQHAVQRMGDPDAVGRALAAADRPMHRLLGWLTTLLFWAAFLFLLIFSVLCLLHII